MLQGALLAQMGRCFHLSLNMLSRLASMLLLALWARLGRCPHLAGLYVAGGPVGPDGTLSPFVSNHTGPAGRHVALWAREGRCPPLTVTLLARRARMLQGALLALMGRCLRVSLTMLAQLAGMLLLALVGRPELCPRLPPVLRSWWTLVGVHSFRGRED